MERLTVNELVAMVGGLMLAGGLFGDWYASVSKLATIAGSTGLGTYSGWDVHSILRWPLLVISIAPFILAYIIVRDHQLTWARGELTAVLAIVAFGLMLYVGVIDRPGDPPGQIELRWGWYVAIAGGALMLYGATRRSEETERRRKPPGTI
jgi:hypothetical protein